MIAAAAPVDRESIFRCNDGTNSDSAGRYKRSRGMKDTKLTHLCLTGPRLGPEF